MERHADAARDAFHALPRPASLAPIPAGSGAGPPVAAVAFMLAMLALVVGLGLILLGQRADPAAGANPKEVAARTAPAPPVICDDVEPGDRARLERGFSLMPRTTESRHLYDQLVAHGICTGVESMAYNGGYAAADRSWRGDWSGSVVMVDRDVLGYVPADVLAALLVHEAAHIDRAIAGDGCGALDPCTLHDNGIVVEEEIAAHAAEARWWLEIYGPRGRRVASGAGYQMDNLALAYGRGPDTFRDFVIAIRGDPREGSGL